MKNSLERRFLVKPGSKVKLSKFDPDDTAGAKGRGQCEATLQKNVEHLFEQQSLLAASNQHAVLVVLQGMDAGGKDGTIRHVMTGLNPQACRVTSFKVPSDEERRHGFLWRVHNAVPRRGEIGIFNRSHYEDVLVTRVHKLVPKPVWSARYDQINEFEKILAGNQVIILKFFLHISKGEQKRRLEQRLADPTRYWKFSLHDVEERGYWSGYRKAYEAALSRCSTKWAPWHVVPANKKWYRNLVVAETVVRTLRDLDMEYPPPSIDISKVKIE